MSDLNVVTVAKTEFAGRARGADGYEAEIRMDDSLAGWWSIVRWNWHYRHWRPLLLNMRDLFTMVLWRKVRRWLPF